MSDSSGREKANRERVKAQYRVVKRDKNRALKVTGIVRHPPNGRR